MECDTEHKVALAAPDPATFYETGNNVVDGRPTQSHSLTKGSVATPEVLPDFCNSETLLRVLIVALAFAVIILLLRNDAVDLLGELAPIALFVGWVALSSLLFICLLQHWLQRMSLAWQLIVPTLIPVINTALVHLGAEALFYVDPDNRLRIVAIAGLLSLIAMHYLYLLAAWKEETHRVLLARELALRARVKPHFLFNSMNSIASLCRSDPIKAEQVTLDLADLFRATFATPPRHTLEQELALLYSYLAIEQTRFGERLQLEWDVKAAEGSRINIPTLVLQPLVENAVQHGIAPSPGGGRIWVKSRRNGRSLSIEIGNTTAAEDQPGTGTATEDARARLHHAFGARARVDIRQDAGQFRATILLPMDRHSTNSAK